MAENYNPTDIQNLFELACGGETMSSGGWESPRHKDRDRDRDKDYERGKDTRDRDKDGRDVDRISVACTEYNEDDSIVF